MAIKALLLAALLVTMLAHAKAVKYDVLKSLLAEYTQHKDIDVFCTDFQETFKKECRDDITHEEAKHFADLIAKGHKRSIVTYINTHLIEQDADLEMTERECNRLNKILSEADSSTSLDLIIQMISDRGYRLEPETRRVNRIKSMIIEVKLMKSCNLGAIGAMFGKVTKKKYQVTDVVDDARNFVSKQYSKLKHQTVGEALNSLEEELQREEERIELLNQDISRKRESIRVHTRSCLIDENSGGCDSLRKEQDILILEKLGITATKLTKLTPAIRDPMYYLASMVENWEVFSIRGKIRNASLILMFIMEYSVTILVIATIILIWFKPETRGLISLGLISSGFGVIPAYKLLRITALFLINRGKGIMITLAISFAVYGMQTQNIQPLNAISILYVSGIAYFMLTDKEKTAFQVITYMAPMCLYVCFQAVDTSFLFERMKQIGYNIAPTRGSDYADFFTVSTPDPEILPAVALALCITIFNLCSLCDSFGYSTYRDVANAKSGKNKQNDFKAHRPAMTDYIGAALNMNSLMILVATGIPGFLSPIAWFWTFSAYSISVMLAGTMYLFMYHDDFIKEGETAGAASDRIMDSMNIIVGIAPKNVILPKFQNTTMVFISLAAVAMGYRINILTACILGLVVGSLLQKNPSKLLSYIGWCCGLVIMFTGSIAHAIIGVAYLFLKLNTKIKFNLGSMGMGETVREVAIT